MATLATHVHVTDDEGRAHVFGPADDVPAWAETLIVNPKAWSEPPVSASNVSRSSEPTAKRAAPRRKAAGGGADQ